MKALPNMYKKKKLFKIVTYWGGAWSELNLIKWRGANRDGGIKMGPKNRKRVCEESKDAENRDRRGHGSQQSSETTPCLPRLTRRRGWTDQLAKRGIHSPAEPSTSAAWSEKMRNGSKRGKQGGLDGTIREGHEPGKGKQEGAVDVWKEQLNHLSQLFI